MKKIIVLTTLLALSTNALAFVSIPSPIPNVPKIQSNSNYAVAMTAQACNIELASLKGAEGEIAKTSEGVVYTVSMDGEVVAQASAKSTFILAKKICL